MQELKIWLEEHYGTGTEYTINYDNDQITGIMYGDDECFDMNDFYQYIFIVCNPVNFYTAPGLMPGVFFALKSSQRIAESLCKF